jgi:hypothetical protein
MYPSYRSLLDRWQYYHIRARFDIDRGRRQRIQGDTSGIPAPQVYVRCGFCNQNVAHSLLLSDRGGRRVASGAGASGQEGQASRLRVSDRQIDNGALC